MDVEKNTESEKVATEPKSTEAPKDEAMDIVDDEKKENVVTKADAPKLALSDLSEQKLFDDLCEIQTSGKASIFDNGKKTFRGALEQQYGLDKKALKKHEPFAIAFERFKEKMTNEAAAGDNDEEPEEQEKDEELKQDADEEDQV